MDLPRWLSLVLGCGFPLLPLHAQSREELTQVLAAESSFVIFDKGCR